MDYELLKEVFLEQQEKLDMYYDNELLQEERAATHIEIHKRDLVNNLFTELFLIHDRETYATYPPLKLIWIKAKKVWIDFVRRLNRETKRKAHVSIEDLVDKYSCQNNQLEFESSYTLAMIEKLLRPDELRLLRYRILNYSYKEIAALENYPSEGAAKSKYYRVRKFLKQHFSRQDFLK